jgi:hypothetical protein
LQSLEWDYTVVAAHINICFYILAKLSLDITKISALGSQIIFQTLDTPPPTLEKNNRPQLQRPTITHPVSPHFLEGKNRGMNLNMIRPSESQMVKNILTPLPQSFEARNTSIPDQIRELSMSRSPPPRLHEFIDLAQKQGCTLKVNNKHNRLYLKAKDNSSRVAILPDIAKYNYLAPTIVHQLARILDLQGFEQDYLSVVEAEDKFASALDNPNSEED